jgi:hypothetical protein
LQRGAELVPDLSVQRGVHRFGDEHKGGLGEGRPSRSD